MVKLIFSHATSLRDSILINPFPMLILSSTNHSDHSACSFYPSQQQSVQPMYTHMRSSSPASFPPHPIGCAIPHIAVHTPTGIPALAAYPNPSNSILALGFKQADGSSSTSKHLPHSPISKHPPVSWSSSYWLPASSQPMLPSSPSSCFTHPIPHSTTMAPISSSQCIIISPSAPPILEGPYYCTHLESSDPSPIGCRRT